MNHKQVTTTDVSIVMVNWNGGDVLVRCLSSIDVHTQQVGYETIVVDNASSDGSPERLAREFPQVRVICNTDNLGYSKAINQGIAAARGRHILLLNPDTEIEHDVVEVLCRYLDQHAHFGAVTGRVLDAEGTLHRAFRGRVNPVTYYLLTSGLRHVLLRLPWIRDVLLLTEEEYDHPRELHDIHGACCLVRREAMHDVGGFDEDFFLYLTDTDFSYRLLRCGWCLGYTPEAVIAHIGGHSSRRRFVAANVNFHRMRLYFYRRHFGKVAAAALMGCGFLEALCLLPMWAVQQLLCGKRDSRPREQLSINVRLLKMYIGATLRWARNERTWDVRPESIKSRKSTVNDGSDTSQKAMVLTNV